MNQSPLRSCRKLPTSCTLLGVPPQSSLVTTLHKVIALGLWNMKISDKSCLFKESSAFQREGTQCLLGQKGVSVLLIWGILLLTQQWACYRLLLLFNTLTHIPALERVQIGTQRAEKAMLEEEGSILEKETKGNTDESQTAPGKQTMTEECQPSMGHFLNLCCHLLCLWPDKTDYYIGWRKMVFAYKYLINSILKSYTF